MKFLKKVLNRFNTNQVKASLAVAAMSMMPGVAHAAVGSLKTSLTTLICSVVGNSSIVMFAAAASIIGFLVLFLTGEGKGHIGTLLKIGIGVSSLLWLPEIVTLVFPGLLTCVTRGGF